MDSQLAFDIITSLDDQLYPPLSKQRLFLIALNDPSWAIMTVEFLNENPKFIPYASIASLQRRPVGFGKNPNEPISPEMPVTINEYLLYYVSHAGVRKQYGRQLWLRVRHMTFDEIKNDTKITERKKEYLCNVLRLPKFTTWQQVWNLKVKGIGDGAKKCVRNMFSEYNDYIDATDLHFQRGIQKVYGLDKKPTLKQIKELTKGWGQKAIVGTIMCNQVHHYGYTIRSLTLS